MEPQRWSEVERVYHLAREQPPDRRNAYLQQACDGDENLRREVESLLSHEDGAGQYLQAAALEVAAQAQDLSRLPAGLVDETEGSLIERLYHAALERKPDEHAEFIGEASSWDTELRRELESLLAQDRSPLALDLYAWICYRVFSIIQKNGPTASVDHPAREGAASLRDSARIGRPAAAAQHGLYQILGGLRTSGEVDEGRIVPGTLVAQRYRIVSLLGRGGMGKVYRADDLLLGHSVALKFLPAAASETALSRFRNEVRTARQVSHPNVCRVYDIGEADGLIYLTMEYVDGEDLASLLRRIGKLPYDKALDIARGLCAGLAAAHDKGMVHRDLKPANVMLDGKGHVRITDFGLAGVAEDVRDPGSGTPAYMAPEQRRGKEVTRRSDIYALGIVLHELFTGKRPSEESKNTELDPVVERVIRRCLEEDPQMRPATALAAAAALPGGDPLAAALAAGEMPSPEVVANAGAVEGLPIPVAVACMAGVIVGLAVLCLIRPTNEIINQIPMENSPEVLAAKAREIVKTLGYVEQPVDTAFGWEYDQDSLRYLSAQKDVFARHARERTNRPPAVYFWYRESQQYLVPPAGGPVTQTEPNGSDPGMLEARLNSNGRLIKLRVQPREETPDQGYTGVADSSRLFAAAGLDPAPFTPTQPVLTPQVASDTRAAWTGTTADPVHDALRIEAATYHRRPVFFEIVGPWNRPIPSTSLRAGDLTFSTLLLMVIVLPIGAGLVAWRNTRIGRGDRRGAFRLGSFAFVAMLLGRLIGQHHVPTLAEVGLLSLALRDALMSAAVFWLLYMAFEPYVRQRLPGMLISWNRLLVGRFRDPLVGADLLVGIVLGVAGLCVVHPLVSPFVSA